MTLFDGIAARLVETPRLSVMVLERTADDIDTPADHTVVFVHGALSSSLVWQAVMTDLPRDLRVIAVDLRGSGGSEHMPIDATRGVRDFSDDLHATLIALQLPAVHLVGAALGAGVVTQFALEHPVLSLTLQAPVSPYGFGGTRRDGSRLTDDDAGCGGGGGNAEFVQRLTDRDASDGAHTSPRSVFRTEFVAPGFAADPANEPVEDLGVEAMLTTSTAGGNYPGDSRPSSSWPGYAAGTSGVLNALAPRFFDVSGIVELADKPPVLWVHGELDAIVSDESFWDANHLGALGILPDWPGAEVAPVQPMVTQTRDVLTAYADAGGEVVELFMPGVGHSPHLENPVEFRRALLRHTGYVGVPADPAPPTEAIILRSAD